MIFQDLKENGWLLIVFALVCVGWAILFHVDPILAPDSVGYIEFNPIRPSGYPGFLWCIRGLFASLSLVPYIQMAAYYLSVSYLVISFSKNFSSKVYTWLLLLGLSVNYAFFKLAYFILPETFSYSIFCLILAYSIRFLKSRDLSSLIWITLFISCGTTLKPIFKCMWIVPGLFFFLFCREKLTLKKFSQLYAPLVIIVLSSCWCQYYKNGTFTIESFLGHNLLGKAGLIASQHQKSSPPFPEITIPFMTESLKQQDLLKQAFGTTKFSLSFRLYDEMRGSVLGRLCSQNPHLQLTDKDYRTIALYMMKENPLGYIQDVVMNYMAGWLFLDLTTSSERHELFQFMHNHKNSITPFVSEYFYGPRYFKTIYPDLLIYALRTILVLAFSFSIYFLGRGFYAEFKRKNLGDSEILGFMASLIIQGGYTVISLTQAGLLRYTVLFWPCIILILVLGCMKCLQWNNPR